MPEETIVNKICVKKENLRIFKEKTSHLYEEMGTFLTQTADRTADFWKMITPYISYFYPTQGDAAGETFIADVVNPNRRELDGAIDRAVKIMDGDVIMNKKVYQAIEEVLGLEKSINNILKFIDDIDIYSENTLIISTKFGEEGLSLARISKEMVMMAKLVNGVGAQFRDYLGHLDNSRQSFDSIRQNMEVMSENYLTKMKLSLATEFSNMLSELNGITEVVNGMMTRSAEAQESMKEFINNIQMEDIIRQKIERIILFLDELEKEEIKSDYHAIDDFEAVILHVAGDRLSDLDRDVSRQYDEVVRFSREMVKHLSTMLESFNSEEVSEVDKDHARLDNVYNRIEELKNVYIKNMEAIVSDKKQILGLCAGITDILKKFDGLFNGISGSVKRFEALNMITRIELARHVKLSRTLGGTLGAVKTLPKQMKAIVKEAQDLYHGIQKNITTAVAQYAANFKLQEQVLVECIDSIKKVSVKLYESQKYYGDISTEIEHYCKSMLDYIKARGRLDDFHDTREAIREIISCLKEYKDSEYADFQLDVDSARQQIHESAESAPDDPVLAALNSEFDTRKSRDQVIIF